MCESSEPDEIIRAFVLDSAPEIITMVTNEIYRLLAMELSEEKIKEFIMDDMPCNYCYWMNWESGELWLKHILNILNNNDAAPFHEQ